VHAPPVAHSMRQLHEDLLTRYASRNIHEVHQDPRKWVR
jgi:hypothetical protein